MGGKGVKWVGKGVKWERGKVGAIACWIIAMQGSEEFDCQNGDSSQNQDKADDFHNKFEHVALVPLVLVYSGLLNYFSLD